MASSDLPTPKASPASVVIDEEEYSILKEPSPTSAVVKAERENLASSLDLKTLVDDLARVGKFIRIAYNATGAAGPQQEIQALQIEIQRLGYDITKLCNKSAVTVASFKSTSRTVLHELQAAYQFLLDGLEDMAVDSLSSLSNLAEKMARAALELQKDFEEQELKVRAALENTQNTKALEERQVIEMKQKQEELKEKEKAQRDLIERYRKLEAAAKKDREAYEKKEDAEVSNIRTGPLESILNAVTSHVVLIDNLGTKLFGASRRDARERAEKWKESSIRKLEIEKENRKLRNDGIQQLTDFLCEMQACVHQQSEYETAIKFLHQACSALKELSLVMMRAALFWSQLQEHCKSLAQDGIKSQIEKCLARDSEEKRLKVWTSTGFKVKAVTYYAKWVALFNMCHEYMGHIQLTQKDLFKYIAENPTRDESRRNLPALVASFSADLSSAQEDIKRLDFKADEKIREIQES